MFHKKRWRPWVRAVLISCESVWPRQILATIITCAFGLLISSHSTAQTNANGTSWMTGTYLAVDSVYSQIKYQAAGSMTQSGGIGGVRAEFGFPFFDLAYLSVGGSYLDGRLDHDGTTFTGSSVKTITSDYIRDLRGLVHLNFYGALLSLGYAERYWYDDSIVSYRRRTDYKYYPVRLTYFSGPYYYAGEYDYWNEGEDYVHMSDVGGGRSNVRLKQKSGLGYGAEIGRIIGGGASGARLFFAYHQWNIDASDVVNDGVSNLQEPKNTTKTYQAGVGFFF